MYTGDVDLLYTLDIRLGTRVLALVVSHPDYNDTEAEEGQPESTLTEEEIRFWQTVLDQQVALLSARRAATA